MVQGAMGAEEDGKPRMVTTPWYDHEIPLTQAAELGTKKVMEDHCTIGVLVTTDGSVTDIPREDYLEAERRSIQDMQATGKPFVVLLNSAHPEAAETQNLGRDLAQEYGVTVCPVNCLTLDQSAILNLLDQLLYEFPVQELDFYLPGWVTALEENHPIKTGLYQSLLTMARESPRLREVQTRFQSPPPELGCQIQPKETDLGSGIVSMTLLFPEQLFYQVLSEQTGTEIAGDGDLMALLRELSQARQEYDRVAAALEQVRATGYGIVMPTTEEMTLEVPEIVRKNGSYGVRLKASAPSIHMLRADINTVLSPMVGDEKQSEDLVNYLLKEYEGNTEKLWESNIFGKSLFELVNEGLTTKLSKMPEDARMKLRETVQRIINEGSGGLICIIL
jgi:stage IV sporulation protein A